MPGEQLTVASLNTRGIPVTGSRLAARYAAIGAEFDAGQADVICFQEVFTYWHLRLLARRMRSFRQVSFRRSPAGPAGGLVTFSRLPVSGCRYRGFGIPPAAPGISRPIRFRASGKGALVTRLASSWPPPGWQMRSTAHARPRFAPGIFQRARRRTALISS